MDDLIWKKASFSETFDCVEIAAVTEANRD